MTEPMRGGSTGTLPEARFCDRARKGPRIVSKINDDYIILYMYMYSGSEVNVPTDTKQFLCNQRSFLDQNFSFCGGEIYLQSFKISMKKSHSFKNYSWRIIAFVYLVCRRREHSRLQ